MAPGGLRGSVTAAADLFDEDTAQAIAVRLGRVLAAVADSPQARLHQIAVLEPAERAQVLAGWNDTAAAVPEASVPELIAARAARAPDAVAVVCGDVHVSYGELDARAGRLAGLLAERGVGPESVVGLCLERGVELVAAIVGVWRAGAAYLPVDPAYPPARRAFCWRTAGRGCWSPVRAWTRARMTLVRANCPGWAAAGCGAGSGRCGAGGAGGVCDLHLGVDRAAQGRGGHAWRAGESGGGAGRCCAGWWGSRVLQFASFSFDASVLDVAVVLSVGGTLVVATPGQRAEPGGWGGWCGWRGAGGQCGAVAVLGGAGSGGSGGGWRGWWWVRSAGGAALAARWAGGRRLVNAYGPTETTVSSTCRGSVPGAGSAADWPAAGEYPGVCAGWVAVPGPAGGGRGVVCRRGAAGAWLSGRAALTAERFVACPFGGPGSGCTGPGTWRAGPPVGCWFSPGALMIR